MGTSSTCCEATVRTASGRTILRLPAKASKKLPSRGQVAARGTINGHAFETVLEPDGEFGHWMRVDEALRKAGVDATKNPDTRKRRVEVSISKMSGGKVAWSTRQQGPVLRRSSPVDIVDDR